MHRGHHHHHDEGGSPGAHVHMGHNGGQSAVQWQTPHLPAGQAPVTPASSETDLDLVEASFVETFPLVADPVSFLRLAGVVFAGRSADGAQLQLLRVEIEDRTDVGALAPTIGGGYHYDPLPGRLSSRRKSLRFAYFDGDQVRFLNLDQAKKLSLS